MSAIEMIPAAEVTAMRETIETLRAELAQLRAQKKPKAAKASRSSSPEGPEGSEGGGRTASAGVMAWHGLIEKTWHELAAAKGVMSKTHDDAFKQAATAAGVSFAIARAEASRRKAALEGKEPPAEPKAEKAPKEPKAPKAEKAPKEPKAPKAEKAAKEPKPAKEATRTGPVAWHQLIERTWHELAAAAGVVSETHDEAFKKAATAAGVSFAMAREEAGRRNAAAKPAKEAKAAKAPYVPYVADDEDDASSVSATPGAAPRELFEASPRGLVAPAHEKED
jgi:hypothetical protein